MTAILYVLVSGFFTVTEQPRSLGVAISQEFSWNFTIKIVTSIPGLTPDDTFFLAVRGSDIITPKTSFVRLNGTACATNGAVYVDVGSPATVDPGDYIVLIAAGALCADGSDPTQKFVWGDSFDISDQRGIIWSGRIQ